MTYLIWQKMTEISGLFQSSAGTGHKYRAYVHLLLKKTYYSGLLLGMYDSIQELESEANG